MMPMSPSPSAYGFAGFRTWIYRHVWHEPSSLPLGEVRLHEVKYLDLSAEISRCDTCEKGGGPGFVHGVLCHPKNSVEPFLEEIVGTRCNVRFFPKA